MGQSEEGYQTSLIPIKTNYIYFVCLNAETQENQEGANGMDAKEAEDQTLLILPYTWVTSSASKNAALAVFVLHGFSD